MLNRIATSWLVYPLLIASVVISQSLGILIGSKFLLPILNAAFPYAVLFVLIREGQRKRAYGLMLFWAFWMTVVMIWITAHYPGRAGDGVLHGGQYADEMIHWVRT